MKKTLFIVLMVMLSTMLMAQWQVKLQDTQQKSLRKLRRCGNIVYGAYSKGYFSSNANGTSFQYHQITDNDSITFYSAWMVDENNIYVAGQIEWEFYLGHGVIFKTTNGGQTWVRKDILESISIPPYGRRMVKDIEFRNLNIGYAITGTNIYEPGIVSDQIFFTSNGGQTWNGVSFPDGLVADGSFSGPVAAYAVNRADGTSYIKYSSSNSGNGWTTNNLNWTSKIDFLNYDNETDHWTVSCLSNNFETAFLFHNETANSIGNYLTTWQSYPLSYVPPNSVLRKPVVEYHNNDIYATMLIQTPQSNRLAIIKSENQDYWHVYIDYLPVEYQSDQDSLVTGLVYANGKLYLANNEKVWSYQIEVATDDQTQTTSPEITNIGCYPNPFKDNTYIKFKNRTDANIEINIFNIKGQLVKQLLQKNVDSGEHQFIWDGKKNNGQSATAGVYFYNLKSGRYSHTGKILLLK